MVPEDGQNYAMSVTWPPDYHSASLKINTNIDHATLVFNTGVEDMVVHELCHLVLATITDVVEHEINDEGVLYKLFDRALETQTENLAAIVLRLWRSQEALWEHQNTA
jgi:hypothetical protein